MIHTVNRNPSRTEVRNFGITILIGLAVIGSALWWLTKGEAAALAWTGRSGQWMAVVLWTVGVVVAAVTLSSQTGGKPIYVVWMTVAMWMGMVMVPLLLTVMYFVVLPVFSLIRFKDPLRLKLKQGGSYWEKPRPYEATIERMSRPF